tara:strand:+ start:3846 stop:4169 length:324 start_codon:yes stop_codon:yes gene_type:complete
MILFKGDYIKTYKSEEFHQVVYVFIDFNALGSPEYIVLDNGELIKMTAYTVHPENIIEEIKTCKEITGYNFEEYQERNAKYFDDVVYQIKEQLSELVSAGKSFIVEA